MSAHFVTCDWGTTGWPMLSMTCEEPPESMCHAVWACDCEEWSSDGIDDAERDAEARTVMTSLRGMFDPMTGRPVGGGW